VLSFLELECLTAGDDLPDIASLVRRPQWHALAACRNSGANFFLAGRVRGAGEGRVRHLSGA
jgi:hypothetical protein